MEERRPDPLEYRRPRRQSARDRNRDRNRRLGNGCLAGVLLVVGWPIWALSIVALISARSAAGELPLLLHAVVTIAFWLPLAVGLFLGLRTMFIELFR